MLKNIGVISISICVAPLMVIGLACLAVCTLLYGLTKAILGLLVHDKDEAMNDRNNPPSHSGLARLRVKHA